MFPAELSEVHHNFWDTRYILISCQNTLTIAINAETDGNSLNCAMRKTMLKYEYNAVNNVIYKNDDNAFNCKIWKTMLQYECKAVSNIIYKNDVNSFNSEISKTMLKY